MSNPKHPKTPPLKQSETSSTSEAPDAAAGLLASIQKILAPSLAFQRAVKDANEDDIRFRWSVEIIRGEDTPFGHVTGTSTLPGLMSDGQIHMVTEKVSAEMISKIAEPVTNKFQNLMNLRALELTSGDLLPEKLAPASWAPLIEEPDLAIEAEIISEQNSQN